MLEAGRFVHHAARPVPRRGVPEVRELQLRAETPGALLIGPVRVRQGESAVATDPILITVDSAATKGKVPDGWRWGECNTFSGHGQMGVSDTIISAIVKPAVPRILIACSPPTTS